VDELVVEVRRGVHVESTHRVHFVACRARGRAAEIVAGAGEPSSVSFVRSAIKMFQALPLVEDGGVERFRLSTEELAVTTASHGGERFHVAAARSILVKAGVTEDALACGAHPPMHAASAEALAASGAVPGRIHNNCSGKHAGMLALARLHGWPTDGYHVLSHPVQQRVLNTLVEWADYPADDIRVAIDGCGLPTFALPLVKVAAAGARLACASDKASYVARAYRPAAVNAASRVIAAMTAHPQYVAGTDRLCTELMRAANGRVFAKVGAEGYYCAGVAAEGLGIALKVEDGAKRASEPALLAILRSLDVIGDDELRALERFARPVVRNTRGEVVGDVVVRMS
jgi:L-asparaginase II